MAVQPGAKKREILKDISAQIHSFPKDEQIRAFKNIKYKIGY